MGSSQSPRIAELDGIRAIAIALVIGCHYQAFATRLGGVPEFGWVGVEIFFVLSGYLITTNLLTLKGKPNPYRIFYARRARRILPPYFLVLFGCFLIMAISTREFDWPSFLKHAAFLRSFCDIGAIAHGILTSVRQGAPSLIHRNALPLRAYGSMDFLQRALGPMWSVSVEEWFYLLWAPVILILPIRWMIRAAAAAIALAFLVRWLGRAAGIVWFVNFFCSLDGLALGAILAIGLHAERPMKLKRVGVGSVILLVTLLVWIHPTPGRELRGSIPFAAFGPLLIGAATMAAIAWTLRNAAGQHPISRALRLPTATWIGRRSYMIYLAHMPVYWIVFAFVGASAVWTTAAMSLALTLGLAAVSWDAVESPLLRTYAKKVYDPPPPPADGAVMTIVNP